MLDHARCPRPTRRSFLRDLARLGGAGITLTALAHSAPARRAAYAQHDKGGDHGKGGGAGGGTVVTGPEIDAGAAVTALALLAGGALLLADRSRRRSRTRG